MTFLILNQYRKGSGYKDVTGKLYHFPVRYNKAFTDLPSPFIYYEPREGGEQVYFGAGLIVSVYEDTEDVSHSYAEISNYSEFPLPLGFYTAPNKTTWEPAKTMRNSIRRVTREAFNDILRASGSETRIVDKPVETDFLLDSLVKELAQYPKPGKRTPPVLRKIKRLLETYERPSFVTNQLKRDRGDLCQLCGIRGFLKRDGKPYCEVHHLFHLANDPPADCLTPAYLVVLCATCHRRMHYADVKLPVQAAGGWIVNIDGKNVFFETFPSIKSIK